MNTKDIIRGIVNIISGNNKAIIAVEVVGNIHKANDVYALKTIANEDKVLGVLIDDKFNICCHVILNEREVFGYFISNDSGKYKFQPIQGFNKFTYDHNKPTHKLGKEISFNESEIKEVNYQFKDIFKSEFKNA